MTQEPKIERAKALLGLLGLLGRLGAGVTDNQQEGHPPGQAGELLSGSLELDWADKRY